jgi:two-component system response regulator YesN
VKRVLVVDDERPVVEAVELMIRRDLAGEFSVVGNASSGRAAIEKAVAMAPDIVIMDIWMPGISGLDAVREIRSRGLPCVFILATAYERFDIAREAMELGVLDYLLKPIARDKLASALKAAAAFVDRRVEIERREMEHLEREERLRFFVEEAFLRAVMMEEGPRFDSDRYLLALGIAEEWALVGAAAFLPISGAPDQETDARVLYESFHATVRYKTRAMAGPYLAGFSIVLLPLSSPEAEEKEAAAFWSTVRQAHGAELARGRLRLGYSSVVPMRQANQAWSRAFSEVLKSADTPGGLDKGEGSAGKGGKYAGPAFEVEQTRAFVSSLAGGDSGRARMSLEKLLEPVQGKAGVPASERYRIIGLFIDAYREFEGRGFLGNEEAADALDLDDIRMAESGVALAMAARSRFSVLSEISRRAPRWSAVVNRAVAIIKDNFGGPISLESVASEVLISPGRLSRLFVEETGRGFSDFLIEVRIERAKELLAKPSASIKRVSNACGYSDPNYFSRMFKKVTGYTPSAFSSEPREGHDAKP